MRAFFERLGVRSIHKMRRIICTAFCLLATMVAAEQNPSLLRACREGDLLQVKRLVAEGAPVNPTNRWAVTPLQLACQAGEIDVAQFLINSGADINRGAGETPLLAAISSRNKSLVRLILSHEPDIECKASRLEARPLHYAAMYQDFETATNLIARGAYLWARDWHNKTPYDLAEKGSFTNLLSILPKPLEHTVTPEDKADCVILPTSTNQYYVHLPERGCVLVDGTPALADVISSNTVNRRLAVVKRSLYGKKNNTDLEPILRWLKFRIVKKEWSGAYGQTDGHLYLPFSHVGRVVTNGTSHSDVQRMLGSEQGNEVTVGTEGDKLIPELEDLHFRCCDGPIYIRVEGGKVTAIERTERGKSNQ